MKLPGGEKSAPGDPSSLPKSKAKSRGRPFAPGNSMGRGRPKSSLNQKVSQARELLEQNSPQIIGLAIHRSRDDGPLLRKLVSMALPRRKDGPVKIAWLLMHTLADLNRASAEIIERATAGKISLRDARRMADLVEARRKDLMQQNMEGRLTSLETRGDGSTEDAAQPLKFRGTLEELLMLHYELRQRDREDNQGPGGRMAA